MKCCFAVACLAVLAAAQTPDLQRAIVIPELETETRDLDQDSLGKIAAVMAKEPASANMELSDADATLASMSDESRFSQVLEPSDVRFAAADYSDIGSDDYQSDVPEARETVSKIKKLAMLLDKAKKVSQGIPTKEKTLSDLKHKLAEEVEAARQRKAAKKRAKYEKMASVIDDKQSQLEAKIKELGAAKAKIMKSIDEPAIVRKKLR